MRKPGLDAVCGPFGTRDRDGATFRPRGDVAETRTGARNDAAGPTRGTMERSVLAELERAELASRARRLAAETEADGRLAAARREAEHIAASTAPEVERVVAELRTRQAAAADAAIAAIEDELARVEAAASGAGEPGDPSLGAAVDMVVAAVLAEPGA